MRAAVRGVIDFTKARVLDVGWWRNFNCRITAMVREDELVAQQLGFDMQRALVGSGMLTVDGFNQHVKLMRKVFGDMLETLYPWVAKDGDSALPESDVAALISAYKEKVGDIDDPVFRKKLMDDLKNAETRRKAPEVTPEDDLARVDRLIAARNQHYADIRNGLKRR